MKKQFTLLTVSGIMALVLFSQPVYLLSENKNQTALQKMNPIHVWYGLEQHFGSNGKPQHWINIVGNLQNSNSYSKLVYSLNDSEETQVTLGSDLHRLAREGDFNIELSWDDLRSGSNSLKISVYGQDVPVSRQDVVLWVQKDQKWELPYSVDFSEIKNLQEVVQIIDGKWRLTKDGVRTDEPYYDRVLSMGDDSWINYEATVRLTIHAYTPPEKGPPTYNVTHFGVALRWKGHWEDEYQPNRKWYPLGAQGEFLIKKSGLDCQWRILHDGGNRWGPVYSEKNNSIQLNHPITIKAQVSSTHNGKTRYRFKQWNQGELEPNSWDVEGYENTGTDHDSGSLCLVPHNTDVTIHEIAIEPIR